MNPDQPSREQIEMRITALLLGELPAEEAALLRYTIAQDPALQKLQAELQATLVLVREAARHPEEPAGKTAPLQLSAGRRQQLLAHFKTPRPTITPNVLSWLKRIRVPSYITALALITIAAFLATHLLPTLSGSKNNRDIREQYGLQSPSPASPAPKYEEDTITVVSKKTPQANQATAVAWSKLGSTPVPIMAPPAVAPSTPIVLPQAEPEVAETDQGLLAAGPVPSGGPEGSYKAFRNLETQDRKKQVAENSKTAGETATKSLVATASQAYAAAANIPTGARAADKIESAAAAQKQWAVPGESSKSPVLAMNEHNVIRPATELPKIAAAPPLLGDIPLTGNLFKSPPNQIAGTAGAPAATPPVAVTAAPIPTAGILTSNGETDHERDVPTFEFAMGQAGGGGGGGSANRTYNPGTSASIKDGSGRLTNDRTIGGNLRGFYDDSYNTDQIKAAPATRGAKVKRVDVTLSETSTVGLLTNGLGIAATEQTREAQRDLAQKLESRRMLSAELESEKVNLNLPQNSLVQITDPATPDHNQSFWQHLTGQYESKARIKVENDVTDIPGTTGIPQYVAYDPYFIQTTFEIIQSELVLSNVVNRLNLQSAWAGKNGGQKLTQPEAVARLKSKLDLHPVANTKLIEIGVTSDDPNEAANLANAVSLAYRDYRFQSRLALATNGLAALEDHFTSLDHDIKTNTAYVAQLEGKSPSPNQPAARSGVSGEADLPLRKPTPNTPVPQPEILTRTNAFSTFSLNVSDVSFKLAEASLQNNKLPDTASIRSEEFLNAFDYRDPEAAAGQPMAFAAERARSPFAHNRELLRFAIKTAAAGRQPGRALNLVLLLDVSGSMERADRVAIIHEALRVLGAQLQPQDTVSVVTFARTARLWADGVRGDQAAGTFERVGGITPEGGTNLEEAMRLAYETAHRHYLAGGLNRVVLLTDGAANLGNVAPEALQQKVEAQRRQGIALDCFGIGWEDYNDDLLERLSSHGDGRYAFLNSPAEAAKDFAAKLAGALQIAAADVKVQVEFNPARVVCHRQIGYATHQLTKEQFRDNTVAAGEIAAQEAGNALYAIQTDPAGEGPVATVHVRYRLPGTQDYREHSWDVPYTGTAPALEKSSAPMRLAATAGAFAEWLAASPYAQEVTPDALLKLLRGVPEIYGADDRPKQLETMIREARSLEGK